MFLHVDLDAFYASVEQLDNPNLIGKPIIVGATPGSKRGVVATCSYEARAYGVHSAMPIDEAYRLCPEGVFLPTNMKRYQEKSHEVMNIFHDFSPEVHQISIDEAFIDLTGTERLFGPPETTAVQLKKTVLEKTGLTVSVGLAANKYIAKIASGISKPDGFYFVPPGSEEDFMLTLPLKKVWGVGAKTLNKLTVSGFHTVEDIRHCSLNTLQKILGEASGLFVYKAVRGNPDTTFSEIPKSRSISAENTYGEDLTDRYEIGTALMELSQTVMFRLIKEGWQSHTVHVKIRYRDFTTCSVQETGESCITSSEEVYKTASRLFDKKYNGSPIRLLGVGLLNLEPAGSPTQQDLFDFGKEKKQKLDQVVLDLKTKNPGIPITKARLLNKTQTPNASEKGDL
ncbi:MAG: DNA polymerase IV [Candidatus Treponema excrementipullorum]|nr:DNA polymerase IV [Spirochaetia bacterium]MDD7013083.1 DNA polymerase IV [Candidatus Treponema excrementipullorum]MCI6953865.1 DNA polymerase IV [Spirochaetia bacterium]MCI7589893.1 DNA polymerase IV [Spirochaetia bacterium]MDY4464989.1 DNA polymerase IV [Candidatus Treponema excrementipullorum]